MPNRETHHITNTTLLAATATSSSPTTSATLDTQDCDASHFNMHIGATLAAGGAYAINESDSSGSGFTAAAAGDVIDDGDALAASKTKRVSYVGKKRYAQLVFTPGGSTILTITGTRALPSQAPFLNPSA